MWSARTPISYSGRRELEFPVRTWTRCSDNICKRPWGIQSSISYRVSHPSGIDSYSPTPPASIGWNTPTLSLMVGSTDSKKESEYYCIPIWVALLHRRNPQGPFFLLLYSWTLCSTVQDFKQCMGPRKRVGIGLSYRPARLYRLAGLVLWNWFLGSLKVRALERGLHWQSGSF